MVLVDGPCDVGRVPGEGAGGGWWAVAQREAQVGDSGSGKGARTTDPRDSKT